MNTAHGAVCDATTAAGRRGWRDPRCGAGATFSVVVGDGTGPDRDVCGIHLAAWERAQREGPMSVDNLLKLWGWVMPRG